MDKIISIPAILLSFLLAYSCVKEDLETTYTAQEERIDSFIKGELAKNEEYEVSHNQGSNRLILKHGEGTPLSAEGTVTFIYAGYVFTGNISSGNLFATNDKTTAEEAGWNTGAVMEPFTVSLSDKKLIKGLKYGLEGAKKGEECNIVFSGKYGFGNKANGIVEKNSALLYHILVTDVVNP